MLPLTVNAAVVANPLCPAETALYDPGHGQDISVPSGYVVSVFASGLNFPTGIAFRATSGSNFEVYVRADGHRPGPPTHRHLEGRLFRGTTLAGRRRVHLPRDSASLPACRR